MATFTSPKQKSWTNLRIQSEKWWLPFLDWKRCSFSWFHCTISADVYCEMLNKLRRAIQNKWGRKMSSDVILHHDDDARSHRWRRKKKIQVFDHPLYNPDSICHHIRTSDKALSSEFTKNSYICCISAKTSHLNKTMHILKYNSDVIRQEVLVLNFSYEYIIPHNWQNKSHFSWHVIFINY